MEPALPFSGSALLNLVQEVPLNASQSSTFETHSLSINHASQSSSNNIEVLRGIAARGRSVPLAVSSVVTHGARSMKPGTFDSFEMHDADGTSPPRPWWFRLGSGGVWTTGIKSCKSCESSGVAWLVWGIFYALSVWIANISIMWYVLATEKPNVFGICFVVVPWITGWVRSAYNVIVVTMTACHLYSHLFVAFFNRRWCAIDRTGSGRSEQVAAWTFIVTTTASCTLLIVGNLVDPGTWSCFVNICVFGVGGTLFIWVPFITPLIMFIFELQAHTQDLKDFCSAVRSFEDASMLDQEVVRRAYFVLYRSVTSTARRYSTIIPVWLANIMFASGLNFVVLLWPQIVHEDVHDEQNAVILTVCVQIINIGIVTGIYYIIETCRRRCQKVLPIIAQNTSLLSVALQVQFCPLRIAPDIQQITMRCLFALVISCATRFAFNTDFHMAEL